MNEQQQYGRLVRARMAARGMTQRDVADITGWSQSVISDVLNGKRAVTPPDVVRVLGDVLELSRRDQLTALGYLDPEEREPGVAYVVREDDPRAALLALLEDSTDADVAAVADLARVVLAAYTRRRTDTVESDRNTSHRDSA